MKVSFISFLGQIFYSENIAKVTGGLYDVVLNEDHFVRLLMSHVHPPPMLAGDQKSLGYLIHMGFPAAQTGHGEYMCLCHGRVVRRGYSCPRCGCRVCSIPSDCPVCHLTLISSSHLARSYHHLFPVTAYTPMLTDDSSLGHCHGCQTRFSPDHSAASTKYSCPKCHQVYCGICDLFIHDSLHNCPGCMTASGKRM
jgi:transcription initiation factor TFIIH subunit 2